MHQEAITRAAIRNINISQRRNEREKPPPDLSDSYKPALSIAE